MTRHRSGRVFGIALASAALCLLSSCSSSGSGHKTSYQSPSLLPGGTTFLVLRNDYDYSWTGLFFFMVERYDTPIKCAWTVEKYGISGNKIAETALGSWDGSDPLNLSYAIVTVTDSLAVITGGEYTDTSYLLDVAAMSLAPVATVFPKDRSLLHSDNARCFTVDEAWQVGSEIAEYDLGGNRLRAVASVSASVWDLHLARGWNASGTLMALWRGDSFGMLDLVTQNLTWTPMRIVGACSFGDNDLLLHTGENLLVHAEWADGALVGIDTTAIQETGMTDCTMDAAGTWMLYRATVPVSAGDMPLPTIVRRNMATGATEVLLQESEEEM